MATIRGCVAGLETTRILYGGSMKPDNVAAFIAQPNIDGGSVGGARLDPHAFAQLIAKRARAMTVSPPLVLAVLDGWGCAIARTATRSRRQNCRTGTRSSNAIRWTTLEARGEAVGLPPGIMGNSEVGHINIGSGRVVPQGVVVIDADDRRRRRSRRTRRCSAASSTCSASGGTLHLMGLLSDGSVHSSIEHSFALIDAAVAAGVPFAIDAFLDGRDTPPRSAATLRRRARRTSRRARARRARSPSVCGRYYAMDRDKRWERTRGSVRHARARRSPPHQRADRAAPRCAPRTRATRTTSSCCRRSSATPRPIVDGDAVIFFNFRPDRARATHAGVRCRYERYYNDVRRFPSTRTTT